MNVILGGFLDIVYGNLRNGLGIVSGRGIASRLSVGMFAEGFRRFSLMFFSRPLFCTSNDPHRSHPTLLSVSSADGSSPYRLYHVGTNHR